MNKAMAAFVLALAGCVEPQQRHTRIEEAFNPFMEKCLKEWKQSAQQCEQFWFDKIGMKSRRHIVMDMKSGIGHVTKADGTGYECPAYLKFTPEGLSLYSGPGEMEALELAP